MRGVGAGGRWAAWMLALMGSVTAAQAEVGALTFAKIHGSVEAQQMIDWVLRSQDHRGRAFAVVDKRQARLFVFDATGRLAGESAVLLGSAPGDHSEPGVSERTQTNTLRPEDRTTPAGRFESAPGRNLSGEDVVWVDYGSAFAIHRLRPGRAEQARAARLATPTPEDNRVSYGCVVVPVAFYERVVQPVLGQSRAVVYVLPEVRAMQDVFATMRAD